MIRNIFFAAACIALLAGCGDDKDDNVKATESMPNWLEVKSEWGGEWNAARYAAYRDYGVTLLANDSLGTIDLPPSPFGYDIQHTERFNLTYSIFSSSQSVNLVYSSDTLALKKAAEIVYRDVLPYIPNDIKYMPTGILFADSMSIRRTYTSPSATITVEATTYYNGMRGIGVGRIRDLLSMSDIEQKLWAGHIIAANNAYWVLAEGNCDAELATFEAQATSSNRNKLWNCASTATSQVYNNPPQNIGYLSWYIDRLPNDPQATPLVNYRRKATWLREDDVRYFMATVYAFRDDTEAFAEYFSTHYEGKPVDTTKILVKYNCMLTAIRKFEEHFNVKKL